MPGAILIRLCSRRGLSHIPPLFLWLALPSPFRSIACGVRLIHREDDTAEKAGVRLSTYYSNIAAIRECYEDVTHILDGAVGKTEVRCIDHLFGIF